MQHELRRRELQGWMAAALLVPVGPTQAQDALHHFDHPQFGKVTLLLPPGWNEQVHRDAGAVRLRLLPPVAGLFDLEIVVAEIERLQQDTLSRRDLEGHLQASLAEVLPQSVEGRISAQRFGLRRDQSLYARLTDKAPPPGDFRIISKGVRLLGRRAVLFTLYSSDADGSLLRRTLDLVSSFTFER